MVGVGTDGPMALPGVYQVRLRAGGRTSVERFTLKVGPRSKVRPADLRAQFAFLQRLRDTVNAVTTAVMTIRNVRVQLEDRLNAAPASDSARLGALARTLTDRLGAIEGELYQVRNRSFQDPLNFSPKLVERISELCSGVGGIYAPSTVLTRDVLQLLPPVFEKELLGPNYELSR